MPKWHTILRKQLNDFSNLEEIDHAIQINHSSSVLCWFAWAEWGAISACSSYGAHQKELEMTKKYFSLFAIFIVSGATVYANPCEDYLESFQKQHNVIGKIDAYSDKGSDIQRLIDRIMIGNILAGMTMNLQLMQKHDCKNLPDYGIDVLGFRKSWQECRLANLGHPEYSKESCSNPVRSKISATY